MTTDITIKQLAAIGEGNAEEVVSLIGSTPGFPKEGIVFRDFTPVLADGHAFDLMMKAIVASLPVPAEKIDVVSGMESRGFLIGAPLAHMLGKGFVPVRKAGKLPPPVYAESYDLEYGTASLEVERTAFRPGQRVLVVDDLIATGGTARAAADLIERTGASVAGFSFVMELEGLPGLSKLAEYPVSTLISMPA